jgi:hypothetical protein
MTNRIVSAGGVVGPVDRFGQRGQAVVLVLFGVFIVIMAGLAIDGGRVFEERRAAQTGADHAATAAAFAACTGGDDPAAAAAGRLAATRNGYDDAATPISVVVDPVVGEAYTFRAAIDSTIPSTFARLIGISDFTVSVEATAAGIDCDGESGLGAIFAGGTCGPGQWGVDVSGSNAEVYGGVHTNDNASTSGSNNRFFSPGDPDDPFTYVGALQNSGSNNLFEAPTYPRDEGPMPWPPDWDPGDVDAAFLLAYEIQAKANGSGPADDTFFDDKVTTITKDGVYYTTSEDGMDISAITWSPIDDRTVVLIAPNGPIKISISTPGRTLNPYNHPSLPRENVLLVSNEAFGNDNDRCSKFSINLSGQAATWNGSMWAPGGMIEFAGSDSSSVNGSVVGWSVKLNGQFIDVTYDALGVENHPSVLLLE